MLQRVRETWDRLGRNNQIILAASVAGVVIAFVGFLAWASTPDYVPLFSNLSAQDANAITSKLSQAGVPYQITQGGSAIEVPAQDHDKWQMKLLSENLPAQSNNATANNSTDILSGGSIGDTQAIQDRRLLLALDQQVGGVISNMDAVQSATVTYAPSNNDPLVVDHHSASAAVFITLKPGQQLSDENVRAIVREVQMSYTGLTDKNISVTDSNGTLLWDGQHTGGLEGDEFHKQEIAMELQKRAMLQSLLDQDFGPNTASVLVHLELNQDVIKKHDVVTTPGAAVTKFDDTEKLTGQGTTTGKMPQVGAAGNMSGAPGGPGVPSYAAATTSPNGNYSHEQTGETDQPNVSTTDTSVAPGQIKRYDVSVMLDSTKFQAAQLPTIEAAIKQLIQANIGYVANDPTQSRIVEVTAVPFNHSAQQAAAAAAAAATYSRNMQKVLSILAPFLIMVLGFLLLAKSLRKAAPQMQGGQLALAGAGAGPGGLMIAGGTDGVLPGGEREAGAIALTGEPGEPHTFEVIEEAFDSNLESILHLSRSKPEMVAVLLKSWLTEESIQ